VRISDEVKALGFGPDRTNLNDPELLRKINEFLVIKEEGLITKNNLPNDVSVPRRRKDDDLDALQA
jgi:hypothetical protein